MADHSYWSKVLNRRATRRRALIGGSSVALSAAFLAACGDDDDGGTTGVRTGSTGTTGGTTGTTQPTGATGSTGGTGTQSGLVGPIEDTSSSAVRGGTLTDSRNADTDSLDPFAANSLITSGINALVYNRLTKIELGRMEDPSGEFVGDLTESFEWSPDRLQLILKLRQGVKFHPIPPVNGREMDVEDVTYSWNRFAETGLLRSELLNSVSPGAPILSLEATDATTLVFNLSEPVAYVPVLLATPNSGNPHVVPKEAEDGFDLRQQPIGTGPFMLRAYEPSVRFEYERNPDYFLDPELPYIDNLRLPIIPEYAAALAQFQAGNLNVLNVQATDLFNVKDQTPELAMYEGAMQAIGQRSIFGWNPGPIEVNPFRDIRVRQAYSMSWDRDLFIDVAYNVAELEGQGLPVETRWNTELQCNFFPGWWLDPQSSEFGENVRYYEHNIEEGRALMSAAGFGDGVEVTSSYFTTGQYGANFPRYVEVLQGMANDVGFTFTPNIVDYATDFPRIYRDGKGRFDGLSYKLGPSGGGDDAIGRLIFFLHSQGGGFTGHDINGAGDFSGDPWIDDTLNKAKAEVDADERKRLAQEVQRYMAEKLYTIRWPGGATGFELTWPAVKNYRVFRSLGTSIESRLTPYLWLDQTQPPFA
jgi:ABC-type transport system substrate-binding protein